MATHSVQTDFSFLIKMRKHYLASIDIAVHHLISCPVHSSQLAWALSQWLSNILEGAPQSDHQAHSLQHEDTCCTDSVSPKHHYRCLEPETLSLSEVRHHSTFIQPEMSNTEKYISLKRKMHALPSCLSVNHKIPGYIAGMREKKPGYGDPGHL